MNEVLKRQIEEEKLGHSYIFESNSLDYLLGQAVDFIRMINSKSKNPGPMKLEENRDVTFIYPDGKYIKIDQIREMINFFQTRPFHDSYKFALIVGGEDLRIEASNAMLKILEEMPAYGKIIILSKASENILATIRSRCQIIKFLKEDKEDEGLDTLYIKSLIDNLLDGKFHLIHTDREKIEAYKENELEFYSYIISYLSELVIKNRINNNFTSSGTRAMELAIDQAYKNLRLKNNNVNFILAFEIFALCLNPKSCKYMEETFEGSWSTL